MKNIIFWAGLFVATFWDEILLASIKPEKTKRQQQFFETGETAQYFIGEVEDEVITLLRSLFSVSLIKKNSFIYKKFEYKNDTIYEVNGGVKNGRFTISLFNRNTDPTEYWLYVPSGYEDYYVTKEEKFLFGDNGIVLFPNSGKELVLYDLWNEYIMEWYKFELYDKVENFEQIERLAETDIELAFILLSGVPNIKKILS